MSKPKQMTPEQREQLDAALRNLRGCQDLMAEPPYPNKNKQRVSYSHVPNYGTSVSVYRRERVAERTLTERKLNGCELLSLWYLSDKDPGRQMKYQPVFVNGRRVR